MGLERRRCVCGRVVRVCGWGLGWVGKGSSGAGREWVGVCEEWVGRCMRGIKWSRTRKDRLVEQIRRRGCRWR